MTLDGWSGEDVQYALYICPSAYLKSRVGPSEPRLLGAFSCTQSLTLAGGCRVLARLA